MRNGPITARALLIGVAVLAWAPVAWAAKAAANPEEGTTITVSGEEVRPILKPSMVKLPLETNEPFQPLPPGSGMLNKALAGPMKGVEEVVFALCADCASVENGFIHHWHLNFGYVMASPEKLLSGVGGRLCKLLNYVDGSHYDVKLTEQERLTLSTWIDCSANYPGTYASVTYQGTVGSGMVIPFAKKAGKDGNLAIPKWLLDVAAGKRCAECHATGRKGGFPAGYYADLVHKQMNLTEPTRSPLLLAPLAKAAGGWGTCTAKNATPGTGTFADASDPDYQRLLAGIREEQAKLDEITRFDMPDFKVNPFYVREMKKYGILPLEADPQKTPFDPYAIDAAYFRSFWHVSGQKPSWENNRDVVEVIATETARGVVFSQKEQSHKTTKQPLRSHPDTTGAGWESLFAPDLSNAINTNGGVEDVRRHARGRRRSAAVDCTGPRELRP